MPASFIIQPLHLPPIYLPSNLYISTTKQNHPPLLLLVARCCRSHTGDRIICRCVGDRSFSTALTNPTAHHIILIFSSKITNPSLNLPSSR
ncbi:hypothetical protein Hanom_Chr04g00371551 [Helianthus anomalus]